APALLLSQPVVAAEGTGAVDPPAVEVSAQDRDAVRVALLDEAEELTRTARRDARRQVARVPGPREPGHVLRRQAVVSPDDPAEQGVQRVVALLHVEEPVIGVFPD